MSWALQQAVFAALTADSGVSAALAGVYDAPPRGAALPYAVIGDATETDWSTKTDAGTAAAFTVTIWSRAEGHKESKLAAAAVRACLDGAALSLAGLVMLRFDSAAYARESDGITRRADLKFRALIEGV